MKQDENDETILRVRAALTPLPPTDSRAVARVLSAVHGRTPQPTPRWRELLDWFRMPSLSVAGATGVAFIALVAGFLAKDQLNSLVDTAPANSAPITAASNVGGDTTAPGVTGSAEGAVPLIAANAASDLERAVPWQFVVEVSDAHTVSVVGDFNDWTVDQAPMKKFANGAWSITLPVKPGRHEYAFVVDGTRWIADPRAPKARDTDFGKPGSVIVVTPP